MGGDGGDADVDGHEAEGADEDVAVHGHEAAQAGAGESLPDVGGGKAFEYVPVAE